MTPDQLERIKAYIGKAKYDEDYESILTNKGDLLCLLLTTDGSDLDHLVWCFIADAINEKLERDDKLRQVIKIARQHEPTYPAMFKHTPNDIIRQVFPPIQLKNLKNPE